MRTSTTVTALALAAVIAVASGCGADDTGDAGSPEPPQAETRLEITLLPEGQVGGEGRSYVLTCDPPGGDHPDPATACATLDELGAEAFAPVPPDVMCTQIYGGPEEARVQGTVRGQPVDAALKRTDGCEIARWERVADIVPLPGGLSA
jgi:hypothetical protein